jgi:phosphoribosyl-ATP pyrophosphohydrolase/phosphoribosyl-AMP cyclohydrolase
MTFTPDLAALDWNKGKGLLPAVVQDAESLRVLMLGYVSDESLRATLASGFVTFFSRSRHCLWQKGETSGNRLKLVSWTYDCDADTLLIAALPEGPVCHTGTATCFDRTPDRAPSVADLIDLARTIRSRRTASPDASYTARLFQSGLSRMAQKVGEEGVEVALAAATRAPNLADEAADLLYHLLVVLEASDLSLTDVLNVLAARAKKSRPSSD